MADEIVTTVSNLITALQRPGERQADVAGRMEMSVQSLSNAKSKNSLPAEKYLLHERLLEDVGREATPTLWFGDNVPPLRDETASEQASPRSGEVPH